MRATFPSLIPWVIATSSIGLGIWAMRHQIPEPLAPASSSTGNRIRIVVVGGGFAGTQAAIALEREISGHPVDLMLISETNAHLFTPMLAEVAASSLEATHITCPLRLALHSTTVVQGRVVAIHTARRLISMEDGEDIAWDHLVLAPGAVGNTFGTPGVAEHAFGFKTLADATAIRNHVITCCERADRELDPIKRRRLVTFVIAGAGFAGAELAGGLNDFVRGMLCWYPRIPKNEVSFIVVHSGERILNELSEPLAAYAQQRMTERGVEFRLKARVKAVRPGAVDLGDGTVEAETVVWTAGAAPHPLMRTLGAELDKRGAVIVDGTFAVPGMAGIWALGDAASIPNAATGKPCPPTAQFAIREALVLARNIRAKLENRQGTTFGFVPLGALCVVGHHTACAEIRGHRFSGLIAWLLWRSVYLSKLPSRDRQIRVLADWLLELFFPRDMVQTGSPVRRPSEAFVPQAYTAAAAPKE
jgi:NADH dehydrogenase